MIRFSIVGQEAVGDVLPARHPGGERGAGHQQARAEHEVGLARRGSARPCSGSARARTGRRGGASRRRRRRAGAPPCSRSSGCRRSRPGAGARPPASGSSRASSHRLVGGGVVDEDDLVDLVERDRGDGVAQRRGRLASGHHDDDLGSRRSLRHSGLSQPRLHVDGSASRAARPRRRAGAATGSRTTPAAIAASRAPADDGALRALGGGAATGRGRGRRAARRRGRRSQPITICPPRSWRDRSTRSRARSARREQRARREVDEVAGDVEVQPAVAEELAPGRCRCSGPRSTITPPGVSSRAASRMRRAGSRQVLERVPEDDRRPLAVDLAASGSSRKSARRGSRSRPIASRPRARSASSSVPSPAPTSRTGPAGAIASMPRRERPRVRREQRVADEREAAAGRRAGTSRRRPPRAPPRSGHGSVVAAPQRAQRDPAAEPERVRPSAAPHQAQVVGAARARSRRRSRLTEPQLAAPADRDRRRAPPRAARRARSKSSASIAAARGSCVAPAAPKHRVVEPLAARGSGTSRRSRSGSQREQPVQPRALLVEELHVARGAEEAAHLDLAEARARRARAARRRRTRRSGRGR